jgi:hypothetical protein
MGLKTNRLESREPERSEQPEDRRLMPMGPSNKLHRRQ